METKFSFGGKKSNFHSTQQPTSLQESLWHFQPCWNPQCNARPASHGYKSPLAPKRFTSRGWRILQTPASLSAPPSVRSLGASDPSTSGCLLTRKGFTIREISGLDDFSRTGSFLSVSLCLASGWYGLLSEQVRCWWRCFIFYLLSTLFGENPCDYIKKLLIIILYRN